MGEWQPIETAPKDGRSVLTARRYGASAMVVISRWETQKYHCKPRPYWSCAEERYLGIQWAREVPPTHWMPLPPHPAEAPALD